MNIKFNSKNVKFTGPMKAFIEQRLETTEKISGDIIEAEVFANKEKLDYVVELIVKTRTHSYQIEDKDPLLKQTLRNILNTLKTQAKKNKEKLKKEKTRKNKKVISKEFKQERIEIPPTLKERVAGESITVSNNFSRKPLSVEEAVFFLKESGENAYMFLNEDMKKMSVVFYNKNKNISIIEAKI